MNKLSETEYEKTVRIKRTDRYAFYDEKYTKVKMFITPEYKRTIEIRIIFTSIDDFSMTLYFTCWLLDGETADNSFDVKSHFQRIKTFIYDKIPKTVDLKWMNEHGFCEF